VKKISQMIARTAFSIALSGALIAAVPGCGRNNTAGAPGAGDFSGSGFSSDSDSSFGESDDAAFEATLSADEEALFSDSEDQLSGVFDTTSDLADSTAESASDSITGYDASLDEMFENSSAAAGRTDDAAVTGASAEGTDSDSLGTPASTGPASSGTGAAAGSSGAGTTGSKAAAAGINSTGTGASDGMNAANLQPLGRSESEAERTASAALKDGIPERSDEDTGLKESVLSAALVECTGWGQSTGSSLHAASAATQLLTWSNQAGAGNVDDTVLSDTIQTEYDRLTEEQRENLKNNWSFISYDVETMLDSFSDMEGTLSDAGCLEAAREAVADKNVLDNWKAVHDVLEDAMN